MVKPVVKIEGSGNELWLTGDDGNFFEVTNLISAPRPNSTTDAVDVTDQKSNAVAEFIGGKITPNQVAYDVYHDPGSDQDIKLTAMQYSREVRPYKIVEKTGRDGERFETLGNVLVISYVPDEASIGDSRKATLTLQPSGLPSSSVQA